MVRYYNELTRLEMEQVDKDETVVMIPVGALEQHGNQCPLGTDEIIAEGTARRIKEALDREIPDYPMLIFPLIPVGLSTEHVNFCGSVTLKPDTFYHVLYDICKGLAHHGFRKIAILNCHGGNSPIIQVLSREVRSELGIAVFIINCGAFFGNQAVKDTVTPGNIWDFHGGEMETSMVLAERPETVKLETSEAGIPKSSWETRHSPYMARSLLAGFQKSGRPRTESPSESAAIQAGRRRRRATRSTTALWSRSFQG